MIEVLVTVAVLSVGLTVILQAYTASFRASVYMREYATAILLAENTMARLTRGPFLPEGVDEEGDFPAPNGHMHFNIETRPSEMSDGLTEVLLTVEWTRGDRDNRIRLNTVLMNE